MATDAEKLVGGTTISTKLADEIAEVSEAAKSGHALLDSDDVPDEDKEHLQHTLEHHGIHAYRYEEMQDGSVIALYANDASGEVKFKTFEDMTEASKWSPRSERVREEEEE